MNNQMTRRSLIEAGGIAFLSAAWGLPYSRAANAETGLRKGVIVEMLPKQLSYLERFRLAKDIGFQGVEAYTLTEQDKAEELKEASIKTGLPIHSVMNQAHWKFPLSSGDPAVVAQGLQGMETSLRNAQLWGAGAVLLVPAVVNPETGYEDAYKRSQQQIRKLIPLAKELKVVIAVEDVWNKFLLSPLEFVRYVDAFDSPWVRAYFDVGNIVLYGYPQDWIRTLGKRIARIHLKDFKSETKEFVPLREGSINWPEVHKALSETGYSGFLTIEQRAGDEAYLREVNSRMDLIIAGK
jgi:L-ribulose-5-phosphate 3-epimerase